MTRFGEKDLSDELSNFYEDFYNKTQYTGCMGVFHNYYHRKLEHRHRSNLGEKILEVGAGYGEHIKFVKPDCATYVVSDLHLDPTHPRLITNLLQVGLNKDDRIELSMCDVSDLPFEDSTFDRVVITCVLHHVSSLELALKEIRRVVKNNGVISIYLPCDPGIVYRLVRHFASHKKQARIIQTSMEHVKFIWSLEHINHYPGIVSKIRWIFKNDKVMFHGLLSRFIPYDFSIFKIVEIKIQK